MRSKTKVTLEDMIKLIEQYNDGNLENDVVDAKDIIYCKTKEELIEKILNEEFSPLTYMYGLEDDLTEEEIIEEVVRLYNLSEVWKGEGYYVAWEWAEEHVEHMDDAYNNLKVSLLDSLL